MEGLLIVFGVVFLGLALPGIILVLKYDHDKKALDAGKVAP
jgi:hypothetical protein